MKKISIKDRRDNSIDFLINEVSVLKIESDGKFYVNGALIKTDELVYRQLKFWLTKVEGTCSCCKEDAEVKTSLCMNCFMKLKADPH